MHNFIASFSCGRRRVLLKVFISHGNYYVCVCVFFYYRRGCFPIFFMRSLISIENDEKLFSIFYTRADDDERLVWQTSHTKRSFQSICTSTTCTQEAAQNKFDLSAHTNKARTSVNLKPNTSFKGGKSWL